MKATKQEGSLTAGVSAILSRLAPQQTDEQTASGIVVVELSTEELDRVSGGMAAIKAARAGTTCSPCADDCGY